jgi:hypothetical protein
MKALRSGPFLLCGLLTAAIFLFAGCSSVPAKKNSRSSHSAPAANDFPTAIQAGIPMTTLK